MTGLTQRLAAGDIVLIDGGTGTEMEVQGATMVDMGWCSVSSLTDPEVVQQVHEDYIKAGAELIISNTYACSPSVMGQAGYGDRFEQANRVGVELALAARAASGADVVVAGSISTTEMAGEVPTPEATRTNLTAQAAIQVEAGIEMIILEMMREVANTKAALAAAESTGLPIWVGYSCTLIDGEPWLFSQENRLSEALTTIDHSNVELIAIMHTETADTDRCLDVLQAHWDGPIGVYAQTGKFVQPHWDFHNTISPEEYTAACLTWLDRGVQVIGGCCGISPAHIAHLGHTLADRDGHPGRT